MFSLTTYDGLPHPPPDGKVLQCTEIDEEMWEDSDVDGNLTSQYRKHQNGFLAFSPSWKNKNERDEREENSVPQ
jgi:hypothetical protein